MILAEGLSNTPTEEVTLQLFDWNEITVGIVFILKQFCLSDGWMFFCLPTFQRRNPNPESCPFVVSSRFNKDQNGIVKTIPN